MKLLHKESFHLKLANERQYIQVLVCRSFSNSSPISASKNNNNNNNNGNNNGEPTTTTTTNSTTTNNSNNNAKNEPSSNTNTTTTSGGSGGRKAMRYTVDTPKPTTLNQVLNDAFGFNYFPVAGQGKSSQSGGPNTPSII